jgi:hypothetical protein
MPDLSSPVIGCIEVDGGTLDTLFARDSAEIRQQTLLIGGRYPRRPEGRVDRPLCPGQGRNTDPWEETSERPILRLCANLAQLRGELQRELATLLEGTAR